MSQDDFKRSVRTSRHDRAPGDAPNMGKVVRMPGTGLPKGERRKRRISEGGRSNKVREGRRRVVIIWSALIILLTVGVLCTFIALWLIPKMQRRPAGVVTVSPPVVSPNVPLHPSPNETEALAIAKAALSSRDPQTAAMRFRLGDTAPEAALDFLAKLEAQDGPITRYEWRGSMNANDLQLEAVVVHSDKDGETRNRLAMLTPDAEGRWQVDFAAFARAVQPSWDDITGKNTQSALVRVYIAEDNYFNGPFSDEAIWSCYGIASPDTPKILNAYCRRDSAQFSALESVLATGGKLHRVVLEIENTKDSLEGQWEIKRVKAVDWVVPAEPYDTQFE